MPTKPLNVKEVLVYLKHEQHAKLLRHKERTSAQDRRRLVAQVRRAPRTTSSGGARTPEPTRTPPSREGRRAPQPGLTAHDLS
jgi:hypothetical protein